MKNKVWVDEIVEALADIVTYKDIKKGETLLKIGEVCDYVGRVEVGSLRMFYLDAEGKDTSFSFFLKKDIFTHYEGLLTGTASLMEIVALVDTRVLLIHKKELFDLYESSFYWQKIGRLMSDAIFLNAKERIDFLLFYTPEQRYIYLQTHQSSILEEVAQKHIASYIGIQPQSLSRIKKRLDSTKLT
ncbi:Crp/Fnr family transcriptional regulator [Myroides odoratus]|uniref:Crp/Fnr family transcriptional regulator n=1 Tax=Myroides odoratus TaxID=256 RepID=UPI0039B0CEF8